MQQQVPFTVHRIVRWGETDPAGIVYTARFLDYAVEAVEAWFMAVVGIDWYRLRRERGLGTPMAHVSLDFHRPLEPAEAFSLTVLVEKIGRSAITVQVVGRNGTGETCFTGRLVPVIVDAERLKARQMPDEFRQRIEAYRAACAAAG